MAGDLSQEGLRWRNYEQKSLGKMLAVGSEEGYRDDGWDVPFAHQSTRSFGLGANYAFSSLIKALVCASTHKA